MLIDSSMVISGFVSRVINDCVDIVKEKIKDADKNRRANEQNIETRIYQVTIDALNEFSYNKYKKNEEVYDAAESILIGLKNNKVDKTEIVRKGLKVLVSQNTADISKEFLKTLCYEICKAKNRDLAIEIIIYQQEQTKGYVHEGFRKSYLNDEEINQKLDYLINELGCKKVYEERNGSENPIKNRIEEYSHKWNENMFLNNFNKRDKYVGVNLKLKDMYLEEHLPPYIWKEHLSSNKEEMNERTLYDLKELLTEYTIDNNGKNMLLILGQPGIGKSTLITWMTANFIVKKNDFLVYQFASDLQNVNWQSDNILNEIFRTLGIEYDKLENKVLILDGFDEIHVSGGREKILNQLHQKIVDNNLFKIFSLIITCRENYVYELQKIECEYITLKVWDNAQIQSFCKVYSKKIGKEISNYKVKKLMEKKEVFGIPLILYMVLALNITIEENDSIVDVYDQIFSLDGGSIYDRCIRNARFAAPHRIGRDKIKQQIHQISKKIAFWIFEHKAEEAYIPQIDYEKICSAVINETIEGMENVKHDFLIGNYFKLIKHCEGIGKGELQFVHRSIYEYFVAVYLFEAVCDVKLKEAVCDVKLKEERAGQLGTLLKDGHLSEQILKFIKYKFYKLEIYDLSEVTKDIFQIMLQDGMTYYTKERYNNIMEREINVFSNMLEIVCLWNENLGELNDNIISYLKYNSRSKLNLKGVKLEDVDLCRVYLDEANLNDANLRNAKLERAELSRAHLRAVKLNDAKLQGANLNGADLIGAEMWNADLCESKLEKADLSGAILIGAKLNGANLNEAELVDTKLTRAELIGAKLNGARLSCAELYGADLRGAELNEIELAGVSLRSVVFDEKQVELLNEKYDLSSSKVYLSETEETVSYKEYCCRKQM